VSGLCLHSIGRVFSDRSGYPGNISSSAFNYSAFKNLSASEIFWLVGGGIIAMTEGSFMSSQTPVNGRVSV
jgi:hypothetical protein